MMRFFEDLMGFLDSDAHVGVSAFKRVVLLIDEFDGIPRTVISPFLYALRSIYLSDRHRCPYSVGFAGIKDIMELGFDPSVSPFNIQDEFKLPNFTVEQVDALFSQYTHEVGQTFDPEVIEILHKQTAGHPFLVNRIAQILTEELEIPKTETITLSHFGKAHALLIQEDNTNFTQLITNIRRDPRFERLLMRVVSYDMGVRFTHYDEIISELAKYGIIGGSADGMCEIINPIYQQYIMQAFQPSFNGLEDEYFGKNSDVGFIDYLTPSGTLDMCPLLDNFKDFIARAGVRILQVPETLQKFVGQYLLSAYLGQFVRSVGAVMFFEVQTGRGRMDLLISHNQRKYIVETKIWEGLPRYQAGKKRLAAYLQLENATEGYYIVFDHRESTEPRIETETIDGVSIRSYVIPVIQQRPSNGHLQTELAIG